MTTQLCSIADLDQIQTVIKSNPQMYGIDIVAEHATILNNFSNVMANKNSPYYAICHKIDNEVVGVVIQHCWEDMPFWSAGLLFINQKFVKDSLFTETVKICHSMLDFMLLNAESKNYNDYLSAVREKIIGSRDKFLSDKFKTEYNINTLETINPFTEPKYNLHKKLLGFTCGKNSKQVIIRHASRKKEFRPVM